MRIALILPSAYRGGTLAWVRSFAKMLRQGSLEAGVDLEIVFCPLEGQYDTACEFADLLAVGITVRPITWRILSEERAREILEWSGMDPDHESYEEPYCLPRDGRNDLLDCDWWCFISDRVPHRILPVRPYAAFIADTLQRYAPEGFAEEFYVHEQKVMIPFARRAEFVMVTTPTTCSDVHSYFGVPQDRIVQLPFFIESRRLHARCFSTPQEPYFVWLSNASQHKNHVRVLDGLRQYYELGGNLKTFLIGTETGLFHPEAPSSQWSLRPYVAKVREILATSGLYKRIVVGGELPEAEYADALGSRGRFLLNASLYDNGSFSASDAVQLGRPCLCRAYPAQQYMDELLGLNAAWFDPYNAKDLARGLLEMERKGDEIALPEPAKLLAFSEVNLAGMVFEKVARRMEGKVHAYR